MGIKKFEMDYAQLAELCRAIDGYLVNTGMFGKPGLPESYSNAHDIGSPLASIVRNHVVNMVNEYYQEQIQETKNEVMKRMTE